MSESLALHRYRIPKERVPVRISLYDGSERRAFIFLGACAEAHEGPERPSDLLNDDAPFFAIEGPDGVVEFLSRQAVAFFVVSAEVEIGQRQQDGTAVPLEVVLDDGRCLEGLARYQLPESGRRLQDFLNLPDRFVLLERSSEVLVVNKRRMIGARGPRDAGDPSGPA